MASRCALVLLTKLVGVGTSQTFSQARLLTSLTFHESEFLQARIFTSQTLQKPHLKKYKRENSKILKFGRVGDIYLIFFWFLVIVFFPNENQLGFHIRYHLFLHYGWFLQNLEKDFIGTNLHTTVFLTFYLARFPRAEPRLE